MPGKRTKTGQTNSKTSTPREARRARPTVGLMGVFWDWADAVTKEKGVNQIRFSCGDLRSTAGFDAQANVVADLAGAENVDGLVIWSDYIGHYIDADEMKAFCEQYHPLPVVSIGLVEGIPSVLVDNYQGVYDEVTHLIEAHDCRRIACIRGPEGNVEADERYRAYVDALAAHDVPLDDKLVVTGGFSGATGEAAMKALFGRRKKAHFDALVAVTDEVAFAAIEFLQAKGIQVPDDVAVVGFDDEGASHTPPVTSVRAAWREATMMAVEMVLALMVGDKVPERVVLPSQLVVRQSCGCPSGSVVHAAAGTWAPAGETLETALATRREEILAAMVLAMEDPIEHLDPTWEVRPLDVLTAEFKARAERLLDAFAAELIGETQGAFLLTLDELVLQTIATGSSANAWQGAISALRRHALPCLADVQEVARAEDLWQQARVLIGEKAERARVARAAQARRQDAALRRVGQALITTLDMEGLTGLLARELPALGIPSCYLSLYDDPEAPTEWARLIMAYDERGRAKLEEGGRRFSSRQLAPEELLPQDRRYGFLVEPLYFRDKQIGFVLFESGPSSRVIYDTLRGHISSALRGALLVQQVENRSRQLQTASEISRAASSILDPDELIQQAVDLARERFDLYYAGLFLMDEDGKWAVLRAGTGKAGQKMVAQGHKLEAGGESMIGQCVATAQARIALDVGKEAVRFEHPLLPETRSEMALPLTSRGQVIGALTIQSAQEAAFSQADITVLQTMADQLANAIENARLFERAQTALADTQNLVEALQVSEEQFALAARGSQDGLWDWDIQNESLYWSPRLKELVGYTDDELDVDFDVFDSLLHPDDREPTAAAIEAHLKDRELYDVEERLRTKSGEYRWFRARGQALWDEDGNPTRMTGYLTDITERKQAEAERERLLAEVESRALQLQTAAEVSRAASSILDPDELIQQAVDLARERFDLYYAGLFLVDESGEWAVLRAGTGKAGQEMIAQGHRLEVGGDSMIGQCLATAQARIALDVGEEAVRLEHPLLPETRAELALPLISRGEAIGALTIQSAQEAAFSQEDIAVLQTMADQLANAIQNARLFEETRSRVVQLTALQETTRAVASTLELDKLLNLITQQAAILLQSDGCMINLVDWEKKEDEVVAASGSQVHTLGFRTPLEGCLSGWVTLHNQPVISNQLQDDSRAALRWRSGEEQAQSAAIVPLAIKDQVIGTLVAMDKQGGEGVFDQADLDLLMTFAGQAAIAIENARLFEQAQIRAEELSTLNTIASTVSRSLKMQDLLEAALETTITTLRYDAGLISLYDGESGRLYLGSHQDLPESMVDKFEREGLAGTLCDVVYQTGDALGIGDLRQGAPVDVSGLIKNGLLTYVGSPIVYQDQVLGTFCLFSRSVQDPAAAKLSLLEAIGQQIGIGIENARLFDQTQAALAQTEGQARRLALLSEMSEQLSRATSFEEIMDISANRVSRIFDADRASVAMLSATGDTFEVFALRGQAGATPLGARVPAQGSEMEMAVRERRLIIKGDDPRPDMGNIRSFMVAPLITGGQAIGTLNVASLQPNAYSERDGTLLLQTAAFISTAIENRRLFEQTQAALEEVEATYRRYLEQEWSEYARTVRATSYETGRPDAPPLGDAVLPEIRRVVEQQSTVALPGDGASGEDHAALVAPIALRGTVIGALGIHGAKERQWTDDEIALIEGIAERLALAAENLRLLDEAQRRATREQLTREVTDRMRDAADMDALMQTSIREIAATLGASSAFVQLGVLPAESGGDERRNKGTGPLPSLDATSNDEFSRKG